MGRRSSSREFKLEALGWCESAGCRLRWRRVISTFMRYAAQVGEGIRGGSLHPGKPRQNAFTQR